MAGPGPSGCLTAAGNVAFTLHLLLVCSARFPLLDPSCRGSTLSCVSAHLHMNWYMMETARGKARACSADCSLEHGIIKYSSTLPQSTASKPTSVKHNLAVPLLHNVVSQPKMQQFCSVDHTDAALHPQHTAQTSTLPACNVKSKKCPCRLQA